MNNLKVGQPIEVAQKSDGKRFYGILSKVQELNGGKKIWTIAVQNGRETKRELREFHSSEFTLIEGNQHSLAFKYFANNIP